MVLELPRFVVLKSSRRGSLLRYLNQDKETYSYLQFSGDEIMNPCSKFEVETAKCDNQLVNIRCCYNNKYWMVDSMTKRYIVAAAKEVEEDQTRGSCTLFRPYIVDSDDDKGALHFEHANLGLYVSMEPEKRSLSGCLFAGSATPDWYSACTFIDWETLVILPKRVVLKGDNGDYLQRDEPGRNAVMQFSGTDVGDLKLRHHIFTAPDGHIRVRYDSNNKFWRRADTSNCYIQPDYDDQNGSDENTLFWPVKISDNVIAIRSLGNNKFLNRTTNSNNFLVANVDSITNEARFIVEEPVLSRKIYNVNFRLSDARIYDQSVITMGQGEITNMTESSINQEMRLKYEESKESRWNGSVSVKVGMEVSFKASIPFIAKGKVDIWSEFEGKYKWGETQKTTKELEAKYMVSVPPMTMMTVRLVATKGCCEVPFSYTQRDLLATGEHVTYEMDDGVYYASNFFNFNFTAEGSKVKEMKMVA